MLPSILTTVLFAISVVCAGRASRMVGAMRAHTVRLIYAFICLALYAHLFGQSWQGNGFRYFLISGALGIALGDAFTYGALNLIRPRLTSLLVQCLCAPFAAVIEWLWLGTTLTLPQMIGCGVILFGTALSLLPGIHLPGALRPMLIGTALSSCASLLQAIGAVLTRKANQVNAEEGIAINGMTAAYQRMCGAVLFIFIIYFVVARFSRNSFVQEPSSLRERWKRAWPWIIANGTTGLFLGIACFQWALIQTPAAVVLSIVALSPLVVIPIAWFVDKERPTLLSIVGSIIAIGGVLILQH